MTGIVARIAAELGVHDHQVAAAIALLDAGSTVPFVARYRKEATGGLDDEKLRGLEERLAYLRELEERRAAIVKSIAEQGKLTDELAQAIAAADTKARLEDLYLPYRPKRRTKAQIAREAGLEPLADSLLADHGQDPEAAALPFVDPAKEVPDVKAALDGARQILMERFAEDAELVGALREFLWDNGRLVAKVVPGREEPGAKFSDYFDHAEPIRSAPSHRALAMFRGRKEGTLSLAVDLPDAPEPPAAGPCEARVAARFDIADQGRPADRWLAETARQAWRVKIAPHIELDLMNRLWESAEEEAIHVFAGNLRDLLLAAPAGPRPTLALDPGFRTGVKVAVIDGTGKLVETATIFPHEPQRKWDDSLAVLAALCVRHAVELVAIGNGTASRETDRLATDLIMRFPDLKLMRAMVSEAGASVYSASAVATHELRGVDVSLRGAASIGRRLQDPLAELVKIDPKSIGVGQYQHDVAEGRLGRALDAVVEDCVNAIGVDVNTASVPLLARVSGLGPALAENIVAHRDANGPFRSRDHFRAVPRLGPKAFEQAAGFLRVRDGEDPLDASSVHPEAYPVVRRIAAATGRDVGGLIGDGPLLRGLAPEDFVDDTFGVPTIADILKELEKPGRDPRPEFRTATFREGVETLKDLRPGMVLEGVVTNVANFGAFVDIGVHQDGLVHVSALADRFVKDPRSVVKPGDVVKVRVLEVDTRRKRIALTMRQEDGEKQRTPPPARPAPGRPPARQGAPDPAVAKPRAAPPPKKAPPPPPPDGALAEAFARAAARRKDK